LISSRRSEAYGEHQRGSRSGWPYAWLLGVVGGDWKSAVWAVKVFQRPGRELSGGGLFGEGGIAEAAEASDKDNDE
jgi:hypothetical protein